MSAIEITKLWNGEDASNAIVVTLSLEAAGDMCVLIDAPFFDDPPPNECDVNGDLRCNELYKYELFELFLGVGSFPSSGDYSKTQYLEVGVGPHGHWYGTMFIGEADFKTCDQDIYLNRPVVKIDRIEKRWNAELVIPVDFIPEPFANEDHSTFRWNVNLFGIHGQGENRVHMAYNPCPHASGKPHFHQLKYFLPITLPCYVNTPDNVMDFSRLRLESTACKLNLDDADDVESVSSDEEEEVTNKMGLSPIPEEDSTLRPSESNRFSNSFTPSKDWYNVGRVVDPDAPKTLAEYGEVYRGTIKLDRCFGRFMHDDEFAVKQALVGKRKGWSHKNRTLILTNRPRLLYFSETGKYKGNIPWTANEQVEAFKISPAHFDIAVAQGGRRYHFHDKESGADEWVEKINGFVNTWKTYLAYEKNKQNIQSKPPVTPPANTGSIASATTLTGSGLTRMGSGKLQSGNSGNRSGSSGNTGAAIIPPTVAEVLEKYRPPSELSYATRALKDPKLKVTNESIFNKFIHADEFVVLMANVTKINGGMSLWDKKRVLILTSKPRLVYLKRTGTFVGTISWSMTTPLTVNKVSDTAFDIIESTTKQTYSFSDANGADHWVNILKEICSSWAAYLKWQVGTVTKVVVPNRY